MSHAPFPHARRWLRLWLVALNLGLLAVAGLLAVLVTRRALFLALLVPLAIAPFSYARLRLYDALERTLARWPRVLGGVLGTGVVLDFVLAAQLATGRASEGLPWLHGPGVSWVGPVWFSAHALLSLGYAAGAIARGLHRLVRTAWARLAPARVGDDASPELECAVSGLASPERRAFLQHASLAGAAVPFFVSLSSVPLSYDLRVDERDVVVPGWPRALDGLRVAHLSDIHVGGGMTRERLRRMAELVNAARPDVVLHTGDFLTHRSGDFDTPLYEALAQIRAPHGQWACLGNHDYDDPARIARRLTGAGVVLLRDQVRTIDIEGTPLEIAGTNFVFARTQREEIFARLFASLPARDGAPRILLDHDPRDFFVLPGDAADLVLSGHTHGGHVGVQLGRDHALTVVGLVGIPDQGVFARGDMRLFVTRCVGFYGYPMRVGIPPEIALLTLRSPSTTSKA
ncbi:metallophosphoesterase [Candidatus Binatia bacterium]|nr:metallophosphoesterase [Candidatus Binatia bacterium]